MVICSSSWIVISALLVWTKMVSHNLLLLMWFWGVLTAALWIDLLIIKHRYAIDFLDFVSRYYPHEVSRAANLLLVRCTLLANSFISRKLNKSKVNGFVFHFSSLLKRYLVLPFSIYWRRHVWTITYYCFFPFSCAFPVMLSVRLQGSSD